MSEDCKPWIEAMMAVLVDGRWHDREEVLVVGMAAVPPGVAWRKGEHDRSRERRRLGYPPRERDSGNEQAIVRGARRIAGQVVVRWEKRGKLERREIGGRVLLRLAAAAETPGTPDRSSPLMARTPSEAHG